MDVHDSEAYRQFALGGSIGAGEAYIDGLWSCEDVPTLIEIISRQYDVMQATDTTWSRLGRPLLAAAHALRRNSRAGSRRNIAEHYDIGNDFFATFLDPTLSYSCAIFERPNMTLEEASIAKIDRVCRKLRLSPADHLLEIGTGWGALAIHAAREYGCRVTTTTISREQNELARRRVVEAGLSDRVRILNRDYRDLTGQYDKLVSIEMIEAVGHQYFDTFFRTCSELLAPHGLMLLQAITVAGHQFDESRRCVDFIKKYVFPGSCIPSVERMSSSVARMTDLRPIHLEDITPHYAETLRRWRLGLLANAERVRALGYPNRFIRQWEYYMAYCEGGFRARHINNVQWMLAKPQCTTAMPYVSTPATTSTEPVL